MEEVAITYETIYELLRREKSKAELQKVDENFFKNLVNYLEEKNSIFQTQRANDSAFSSPETLRAQKQIENIKRMVNEFYERRESKIIQMALTSSRSNEKYLYENMLESEKKFFSEIIGVLDFYRRGILYQLLNMKEPTIDFEKPKELKSEPEDNISVSLVATQDIPELVGKDMEKYGPFLEGEEVNLPEDMMEILIKGGCLEERKNENSKETS